LQVTFPGAADDPENDPLTYEWDFGDGSPTETGSSVSHTYTNVGTYQARLSVSDPTRTTLSDPIDISVGTIPIPTIAEPIDGTLFRAGDVINFSGSSDDPTDTLEWNIELGHDVHFHPRQVTSGSSGTYEIPSSDHPFNEHTFFRFTLTATDADGLSGSTSVQIDPDKVNLSLTTNPPGLEVLWDGIAVETPAVIPTLIGFQHTITAPSQQPLSGRLYQFDVWSHGGPAEFVTIIPNQDVAYNADYVDVGAAGHTIEIHAGGQQGDEEMQLWINGSLVELWTLTGTALDVYTVTDYPDPFTSLQVKFTNNGGSGPDRNLRVDKVVVDGVDYQTENPSVLGTAVFDGSSYCVSGNYQTEWLYCNGYFEFQVDTGVVDPPAGNFDMWDTCWRCITRGTDDAELLTYLDYLESAGFDGTWIWVVPAYWGQDDFDGSWGGGVAEPNWRGNAIGDLGSPGSAYLDDVAWFLDRADERGLKVGLVPAWGSALVGTQPRAGEARAASPAEAPLNEANAFSYGQAMAAAFGGHPAIEYWVFGGDWAYDVTEQGSTTVYWQDENATEQTWINLKNGIRTGDASTVTYHTGPYDYSRSLFSDRPWNEALSIHTSHCTDPQDAENMLLAAASFGKPIISAEMRYETWAPSWCPMHANDPIDEFDVEADAYAVLNSGAAAFVYGHQDRWRYDSSSSFLSSLNSPGAARAIAVAGSSNSCGSNSIPISFAASGFQGDEIVTLKINDVTQGTFGPFGAGWPTPQVQNLTYTCDDPIDTIRIEFDDLNNPDQNVEIDSVIVDGVVFESEVAEAVGISIGGCITSPVTNHGQERMYCDGYFEYQIGPVAPSDFTLMFVGNSITEGTDGDNAYRGPFETLLTSAGYSFDFIGTRQTSPGGIADPHHEGRGGATSDERYAEMLASNSYGLAPDYVFIHLGTNNIFDQNWNSATPDMPTQFQNDLEAIIDEFRIHNPNIAIFLAQPIPCDLGTVCTDRLEQLRPRITAVVAAKHTTASPVIEVDHRAGFDINLDLKADNVHPSVSGRQKMADTWLAALEPVLLGGDPNQFIVHQTPRLQLGDAPLTGYAGSTTDQIEIIWQTLPGSSVTGGSFEVQYRATGAGGWLVAPPPTQTALSIGGRINHSTVITGLNFGSSYEYRVRHFQDTTLIDTYQATFATRLAAGDATAFSFVAYGDSANPVNNAGFESVQAEINTTDAAFALLLGDNAYDTATTSELDARFTPLLAPAATTWNASHVDYLTFGNHELADGLTNGEDTEAAFSVPVPLIGVTAPAAPVGERPEHNYSFDYGDVHIVVFDSEAWNDPTRLDTLLTWIEADLAASDSRWQIVAAHLPVAGAPNYPEFNPSTDYYQQIVSRLGAAGVDLFLSGHDHTYFRSYPLTGESGGSATFVLDTDNSYAEGAGLVQVTSARGGHSLRGGDFSVFPFIATGVSNDTSSEPGFVKIDVTNSALTVTYLTASGTILDSFSIDETEDTTPPTVSISDPADGSNESGPNVTIAGTAFDAGTGVDRVRLHVKDTGLNLYWDGSGWTSDWSWFDPGGTESWSYPMSLNSGSYQALAWSWDGANNISSLAQSSFSVGTADTTPPTVTITNPA
ncbi:MAG: DUF4038 domain-containing protein, partial [Acidimicrobiia bacterium]|nr:DUF4038 domain-containing protein [Acidimicrobiia bacterium]